MSPAEPKEKTGLLLVTLLASIIVLADLVGFMQWYKDLRSYIVLPVATMGGALAKNVSYTLLSIARNESLKKQNIELRQKVIELESLSLSYKAELDKAPELTKLAANISKNSYGEVEQSQILDTQASQIQGLLQLNKGSSKGITVGMPVVFGSFYVGTISAVTQNDSICTTFLVPGQEFVGYVQNKKITGIVKIGINGIELGDLLATEQVALHDIVSIKRDNYPYLFTLGLVNRIPLNNGSAERKAVIESQLHISDLTYVTIVKK